MTTYPITYPFYADKKLHKDNGIEWAYCPVCESILCRGTNSEYWKYGGLINNSYEIPAEIYSAALPKVICNQCGGN